MSGENLIPCFAVMYSRLRYVAVRHGYCLAIHGTMTRDFDLLAVPWVDDASSPDKLFKAIMKEAKGFHTKHDSNPTIKPHGRLAYSIHLGGGPYIDLSVFPIRKSTKVDEQ